LLPYLTSGEAFDSPTDGLGNPIGGTVFDELYQIETFMQPTSGHATFTIPVEVGDYTVHLHFVDWVENSVVGSRVFNVELQGQRVISNLDIVSEVGHSTSLIKSFDIDGVQDSVSITLSVVDGYPEIAAVEIVPQGQPYLGEGIEDTCGDGHIDEGENCDDGNGVDGDGCSSQCSVESGWTCTSEPSECEQSSGSLNSVDLIWEDAFGPNQGDPAGVSAYYDLFYAAPQTFPLNGSFPKTNGWMELIEGGDGAHCSLTINTADNTVVEIGRIASWIYYENGGWEQFDDVAHLSGGTQHPYIGDPFVPDLEGVRNYYGCPDTAGQSRLDHMDYSVYAGNTASGNGLYKPKYGWIFHGWGNNQVVIDYSRNPKAVLVTLFARLVVENPSLPDDRANAHYVIHSGSDRKNMDGSTTSGGDIGISRWKRVTNEWQPFNFITGGWTKDQFIATSPPVINEP